MSLNRGFGMAMLSIMVLVFVTPSKILPADRLYLKNGDRITGTLEELSEQTLRFTPGYGKTFEVPVANVRGLETGDEVTVRFENDAYVTGRLRYEEEEDNQLRMEAPSTPLKTGEGFTLDRIREIHRNDPRSKVKQELSVKLSGNLNAGLERLNGNTSEENYRLDGRLQARTPTNRYTVSGEYNRTVTDGDETENDAEGRFQYDHFVSERWFLFQSVSLLHDEFRDIHLRTTLASGAGYQVIEREELSLSVETGASYVNEDFVDAEDQDHFGGLYGINYEQTLDWGGELFHYQEGLYGSEADFVLKTQSGLRFPLRGGWQVTTQYDLDWEADPVEGTDSTTSRLRLSLGYSF